MRQEPTFEDYTAALTQQRNDALNDAVNARAALAAAEREIERLTALQP